MIVSSIGSPLHDFAKLLLKNLKKGLEEPNFSVKNSVEFIRNIKNIKIPSNHVMMSLDVTSLFTYVPNDLVIKSIKSRWPKIQTFCKIPWNEVERALELILKSTYFTFDGKRYRQIEGSPMGNPLSPFFAEVVMRDLEMSYVQKLNFKPLVYFRYVDDIFALSPWTK